MTSFHVFLGSRKSKKEDQTSFSKTTRSYKRTSSVTHVAQQLLLVVISRHQALNRESSKFARMMCNIIFVNIKEAMLFVAASMVLISDVARVLLVDQVEAVAIDRTHRGRMTAFPSEQVVEQGRDDVPSEQETPTAEASTASSSSSEPAPGSPKQLGSGRGGDGQQEYGNLVCDLVMRDWVLPAVSSGDFRQLADVSRNLLLCSVGIRRACRDAVAKGLRVRLQEASCKPHCGWKCDKVKVLMELPQSWRDDNWEIVLHLVQRVKRAYCDTSVFRHLLSPGCWDRHSQAIVQMAQGLELCADFWKWLLLDVPSQEALDRHIG
jgi:hypothetical protein